MAELTQELSDAQDLDAMADPTSVLLSGRTEENLREADKIVRDAFCIEYCKLFDAKKAMHAIGVVNPKTASTKGSVWLREPYCMNKIRELIRVLKDTDIIQRNEILAGVIKEAQNEVNDGSTRVAAWALLAKMTGAVVATKPSDTDPKIPMNVLLMPVVDMNAWASQSAEMQRQLMVSSRDRTPTLQAEVIPG